MRSGTSLFEGSLVDYRNGRLAGRQYAVLIKKAGEKLFQLWAQTLCDNLKKLALKRSKSYMEGYKKEIQKVLGVTIEELQQLSLEPQQQGELPQQQEESQIKHVTKKRQIEKEDDATRPAKRPRFSVFEMDAAQTLLTISTSPTVRHSSAAQPFPAPLPAFSSLFPELGQQVAKFDRQPVFGRR